MKFLGIDEINKKDTLIYYRNEYSGSASFALIGDKTASIQFSSNVEIKPTGEREIIIRIHNKVDYPLIDIIRTLKKEILKIEMEGLPY